MAGVPERSFQGSPISLFSFPRFPSHRLPTTPRRCTLTRIRISNLVLICVCLVGLNQSLWAQTVNPRPKTPGILGHFDPQTGTFKPLEPSPESDVAALAAIVPTTGKFVFTITIKIVSTNLASDAISCDAVVTPFGDTSGRSIFESASVAATGRTATAAKCVVTIPYSWLLSSPASDHVILSVVVFAENPTAGAFGQPTRTSSQTLGTIPVPVNGSTTPEAISVTI